MSLGKIDINVKPKKIVFNEDDEAVSIEDNSIKSKKKNTPVAGLKRRISENDQTKSHKDKSKIAPKNNQRPKKIIFNDDGEVVNVSPTPVKNKKQKAPEAGLKEESEDDEDFFTKKEKEKLLKNTAESSDEGLKWYQVYPEFPSTDEVLDMKENEQSELFQKCKTSLEAEMSNFIKKNPSDAKWLQTAVHKGTARDRANAGALLVTSNTVGNLKTLETLISYTKSSNKSSPEVIAIFTDLLMECLLPPHRKLLSIQMRGADWKIVKKNESLTNDQQRKIYAYWYYENELKEHYFEFLKNIQQGLQTGQENYKSIAISAASRLLKFAPEKEQMLLTMLVNKLGDPVSKIASKALHHLSEVAHKHPNMCGVITAETEKLLFRNNISDRAQHFGLCFLAQIAPSGRPEVCTKLVNICFALFRVLVKKGAVNNRTMQAILRCLQKAILEAQPPPGSTEIMTKDMQGTIYRLVHLADIRISIQTLALLLQLVAAGKENANRFYNALYKKMLDIDVITIGNKTASQFLHVVHRALHIDANSNRVKAFIKRLLQMSLYMSSSVAAGCLVVIHKLIRMKPSVIEAPVAGTSELATQNDLDKFDSDGEEKYEDVPSDGEKEKTEEHNDSLPTEGSSWHHVKIKNEGNSAVKATDIYATKYDPYHRVPEFAGAELTPRTELLFLIRHFHPTVHVFAENLVQNKKIDYYGDPLRDFSLPHFLERFAFKNPKKLEHAKDEAPIPHNKQYVSYGGRGKPVKSLTKTSCTEDEIFIFNYLEKKREAMATIPKDESDGMGSRDVDDDEFEEYLDGFFGKKGKAAQEEDLDFLGELSGGFGESENDKKKSKKSRKDDDDKDDVDEDWNDEAEGEGIPGSDLSDDDNDSLAYDEEGSISLNESDDDGEHDESASNSDEENEDLGPPKTKKHRPQMNAKSFSKTLKHSDDMSSLFAAADDFAELLEETGKTKGQGTLNAVFNKDKASDKQMKWESNRMSNSKKFKAKGNALKGSKKFGKKSRK